MLGRNYPRYTPAQLAGSEYGGTTSRNTVQPKGAEALSSGDELRLGYLVGSTSDPLQLDPIASLEDRRQMMGLKPSTNQRPLWLDETGRVPEAAIQGADYPDSTFEDVAYLGGDGDSA